MWNINININKVILDSCEIILEIWKKIKIRKG